MPFVPAVQQYTPIGVQLFDLVDPTVRNTMFNLVASTFTAQAALTTVTVSTQLTATLRNVLVDVTGKPANTTLTITLPVTPALGDPSCNVVMLVTGTSIPANVIVTTSDGTFINGIDPSLGTVNQPAIHSAGASLYFVFVDYPVGWLAIGQYSTPSLAGPWAGSGALPWQGQTVNITGAAAVLSLEGLQVVGARATIINSSGGNITAGDATSTFNGTPGPYSFGNLVQATFVCTDVRAFTVTI